MYRTLVGSCFLVCLLLCQRWRVSAAPHRRHHHGKDVFITIVVDNHVAKLPINDADAKTNILRHTDDAAATAGAGPSDLSKPSPRTRRVRRSIGRRERDVSLPAVEGDDAAARHRRSVAAVWLQATIEMCNNLRVNCEHTIVDGDTTIRIEEM